MRQNYSVSMQDLTLGFYGNTQLRIHERKVSFYLFGHFLFKQEESQTVLLTHFLLNGQLDMVPKYKSLMSK